VGEDHVEQQEAEPVADLATQPHVLHPVGDLLAVFGDGALPRGGGSFTRPELRAVSPGAGLAGLAAAVTSAPPV
jgi:hypothetical protein